MHHLEVLTKTKKKRRRSLVSFFYAPALMLLLAASIGLLRSHAQAAVLYSTDTLSETESDFFVLDADDSSATTIDLQFGSALSAMISFDVASQVFQLSHDLDLAGNEILDTASNTGGANQMLVSDGAGANTWTTVPALSMYEVYESGTTTLSGGTATQIDIDTQRNIDTDYTLAGGTVTFNVAGDYSVEYSVSIDCPAGNSRTSSQTWLNLNAAQYPGSLSWAYHRNSVNGEDTASKKVRMTVAATDTVSIQSQRIAGACGLVTRAGGSNLVIEKK